jgi:predicted permease
VTATQLTAFFAVGRNPVRLDVHYDWKLVALAGAAALGGALMTGLWPGLRACRADPQPALKGHDARVAASGGVTMPWRALLAGQMAIALVLLLSSVVFARTLVNLRTVDLGFNARNVLTLSVDPRFARAGDVDPRERFWTQVLDRVRALPGTRSASLSVLTPLSGRDTSKIVTGPGLGPLGETDRIVHVNHVSEDYFRTFGIPLLAGRAFGAADAATADRVIIVNEATVRAYFGGRNPIGGTLGFGPSIVYRIVGVVRDHKHTSVRHPAPRFAYVPLRQRLDPIGRITLAVASDQPPANLAWTVANQVRAVHADTLVSDVIGVEEQIDAMLVSERLLSILATLFAAVALGLAAIGLVGVVSYSVARRRTELAVRLALGASPARVAWEASRDALVPVLLGIVIGMPLAFVTAGLARGLLFGVTPAGADSYVLSAAVLAIVACLATWIPARRASNMDPLVALRHE